MPKTLVIDLDGTICSCEKFENYPLAVPFQDVIDKVNKLHESGWEIIIFTARGMDTFKGDANKANSYLRKMTEFWLNENKVQYTKLVFGKPSGDLYVDDKGISVDEFKNFTI